MRLLQISWTVVVSVAFGCGEPSGSDQGDASSDADTDGDSDTDADSGADTDTELPTDCTGLYDFTLCQVVTDPERSYDICIDGICRSPGCGTVDCNPPGPHFPSADTGQRSCYDSDSMTACPYAGEPFYGQDAQYGWDATHAATERFTRDATTWPDNPVVADNATGLLWQGCAAGATGELCTVGTALTHAWSNALTYCDTLSWGGHDDWRLPDRFELQSILSYESYLPAIDAAAFPATPSDLFWSSSSAVDGSYAWHVYFAYGQVNADVEKVSDCFVRCVRGEPTKHPARFVRDVDSDPGRPTVADEATGLEWQGCAAGLSGDGCADGNAATFTWSEALGHCEALSWGGHDDWRLPSAGELTTIYDDNSFSPAIDAAAFPAVPTGNFWSSSSAASDGPYAWFVDFYSDEGYCLGALDKTNSYRSRCVRDGLWD